MRPTQYPDRAPRTAAEPADLARTRYDSRQDPDLPSATRSSTVTHMLVLESADLCLELECFGSTVVGQVVPPAPTRVELICPGRAGGPALETDAAGAFVFDRRRGPFRLKARTRTGATLQTHWLPATG